MITENYVNFKIAKLLRDKGFDEPCKAVYEEEVLRINTLCDYYNSELSSYVCAPTHQMAMKWLREVHNIDIIAFPQYYNDEWHYSVVIFILSIPCTKIRLNDSKDKKEEAIESGIEYVLKNIIQIKDKNKKKLKFDTPNIKLYDAIEVKSRLPHVPEELKPIAEFIIEYAHWNLNKDEVNRPAIDVPLYRVLDALIQGGRNYKQTDK